LAEHAKDADFSLRKLLGQLRADGPRTLLIKRIDQQRAGNLFVAAAQFLFHRHRHAGGIERQPYFAAGHRRVGAKFFQHARQRRLIRRLVEPGGDGEGAAETAAPDRAPAHRAVHVDEDLRHDRPRHRRRIVEPFEIWLRGEDFGRFDHIEIEIARRARNRLVAAAEHKARHGEPLDEMLALEPGFEFRLAPGAAIVEDGEYSGTHRAATTMISTV